MNVSQSINKRSFFRLIIVMAICVIAGCTSSVSIKRHDDFWPKEHNECRPVLLYPSEISERDMRKIADINIRECDWLSNRSTALNIMYDNLCRVGADAYRIVELRKTGSCWHLKAVAYGFSPTWKRLAIDQPAARAALDSLASSVAPIEGIWNVGGAITWTDPDEDQLQERLAPEYCLAILRSDQYPGYEYVASVLESSTEIFGPGDIKALIRETPSPHRYDIHWYNEGFIGESMTVDLENASWAIAESRSVGGAHGEFTFDRQTTLNRVYPINPDSLSVPRSVQIRRQLTGVLVREDGYLATTYNGVANRHSLSINFPGSKEHYAAQVAAFDEVNNLAILHLPDFVYEEAFDLPIPFRLGYADSLDVDSEVATIGYPVSPLLTPESWTSFGENFFYVVIPDSGIDVAPSSVLWDISEQPGGNGGAVFSAGELIGIAIPQHETYDLSRFWPVDWFDFELFIDSKYLITLLESLPNRPEANHPTPATPEQDSLESWIRTVQPYVALIAVE